MSDLRSGLERVRRIAGNPGGVARLSEESGLPYSSIHSFVRRKSHRSAEFLIALAAAADRLTERDAP